MPAKPPTVLVPRVVAISRGAILLMVVAACQSSGDDEPEEPSFCEATEEFSCPTPSLIPYDGSLELGGASVLLVNWAEGPQGVAVFSAMVLGRDGLLLGFSVHEDDCSHICVMPEVCTTTVCTNASDCTVCLPGDIVDVASACFDRCGG